MVQMIVRLTAVSGRAHQVIEALHIRMREIQSRRGCTETHLAADVDEANAFWYCEEWRDEQSLEDELRTDRFSQLLSLIETSASPPALEFRIVTATRGLDYVTAARDAASAERN